MELVRGLPNDPRLGFGGTLLERPDRLMSAG
jgi:hypothetical protein